MDEESNIEVIPLNPRSRNLWLSKPGNQLVQQACWSVVFHYVGWYFPRYWASWDDSIENIPPPYQTTAAGDVILDPALNQPLIDPPTIGSALLHFSGLYFPLLVIIIVVATTGSAKTRYHELHAGCCGVLTAVGLSEGATVLLKTYIHRRRPNFYALCAFDTKLLQCTATVERIREASFSFPSGHSSLTNCGMTFLVWFLLGRRPRLSCVLPWSWACFVGASRIVDSWHHPSDVLAGLLLGGMSATIVYHAWFPPVWSAEAGQPLAANEFSKSAACDE